MKTWRLDETSASPRGEREEALRRYCAIIPNTTAKTHTTCLHMSGTFYIDDIPQSKYPFLNEEKEISQIITYFHLRGKEKNQYKKQKEKIVFWYLASPKTGFSPVELLAKGREAYDLISKEYPRIF